MIRADDEALTPGSFSKAGATGEAVVSLDGRFLDVNHALCEIVGYPEVELCAMGSKEITHPDDHEVELSLGRQLLAGEIRGYEVEKRVARKNGEIGWVLVSTSLARSNSEEPIYFISQIHAIADPGIREVRA